VVAASSAQEAIDLLKEKPVEGVLLEYNLPDEICIQMQAEVKRIQPDVPVVWFAEITVPSVVPLFEPHMQSPACETLAWEISGLDSFLRSRHSAKKA
jgi:DNA-binding NtrC family response regulator